MARGRSAIVTPRHDRVAERWALHRSGWDPPPGPPSAPLSDAWDRSFDDLQEREGALGISESQPILLRPDGSIDGDVLSYLHDYSFQRLASQTQLAYATDLKVYFSFLWDREVDWLAATPRTLRAYAIWRLVAPANSRTVHDTRFARELASIRRFYDWAVREGKMTASPVELRAFRLPDGTFGTTPALRPRAVRSSRVKWLTPNAYVRWRREGLEGYGKDGLRARSWRGRNEARNVAFCETLWWSGLRLREASTLLSWEVPREIRGENWAVGAEDHTEPWHGAVDLGVRVLLERGSHLGLDLRDQTVDLADLPDGCTGTRGECPAHGHGDLELRGAQRVANLGGAPLKVALAVAAAQNGRARAASRGPLARARSGARSGRLAGLRGSTPSGRCGAG